MKKYIGTKDFYKKTALILIPIVCQQLFNSAMGIVDSVMVSSIGEVTSVGTASQIENLCITICWGAVTGIGVYAAQFFGAKEYDNMKKTFGLSSIFAFASGLLWMIAVTLFPRQIMEFFIQDEAVIVSAMKYLEVAKFTYIPLCVSFSFSYMYRCAHNAKVPMVIGIITMVINCFFDYSLIFGKFGMPELGVAGAAYGTLISQVFNIGAFVIYTWGKKMPFVGSFKEMFGFKKEFVQPIIKRTLPMMINEGLFGFGMSLHVKALGILGKAAMDSYYVSRQITGLFYVICGGVNSAASAVIGAELGKDRIDTAKQYSNFFLGLAAVLSVSVSLVIMVSAGGLVSIFGLTDGAVFDVAVLLVRISSIRIALRLFNVVVFAALRAGGDAKFLAMLDSGIMLGFGVPLAYFLVLVCGLTDIAMVFLLVQLEQVVRMIVGIKRFRGNIWAKNLTQEVNG